MPLPDSQLSPGDHIHIDKHAFTKDIHVKVALDLFGYDPRLWGGLTDTTSSLQDPRCFQSTSEEALASAR
jgi:hypothetical protein